MTSSSSKKLFSYACIALLSVLAACGSPETNNQAAEEDTDDGARFNIGVDTDARVHIVPSSRNNGSESGE